MTEQPTVLPVLRPTRGGDLEATCGRCLDHSVGVSAEGGPENAWAQLQRLGAMRSARGARGRKLPPRRRRVGAGVDADARARRQASGAARESGNRIPAPDPAQSGGKSLRYDVSVRVAGAERVVVMVVVALVLEGQGHSLIGEKKVTVGAAPRA